MILHALLFISDGTPKFQLSLAIAPSEKFENNVMHKSFVATVPHLQGKVGDSRAKVQGDDFSIVHTVWRSAKVLTLGSLPPVEFSVMWGGAKSWAITISVYQGTKNEKSLCPLGGWGMITND